MDADGAPSRAGEVWGGLAAALVVLPSSVAFGIVVFSPLGSEYAAAGALAGLIGSIALGIVAPAFGGTKRLVTAPCAPAAAVLSAMALRLTGLNVAPGHALILLAVAGLAAGALQVAYGLAGGGRLIKYIPYPVVAGYLSGVGLTIFLSQLPKFFGFGGAGLARGLLHPDLWSKASIAVGAATIAATVLAPRLTKAVPASIVGLAGGIAAYFGVALFDRALLSVVGNPLVVGPIQTAGGGALRALFGRWSSLSALGAADLRLLTGSALTLSVLLSIDTLKTCVVIDNFSDERHDSNRELVGQGLGNIASAVLGGMAGSGQMGATLVNINSGGRTKLSSLFEGVFCLAAFVALGRLIAWVPVAALAGILIIVAYRMFDTSVFSLVRQRSTVLDFCVVLTVVLVAVFGDLIAASGTGVGLAILLFIRDQMGASVIRRKTYGDQVFSKQRRVAAEQAVLQEYGGETVLCQLQGSLFFGTTDQLYTDLEKDLVSRKYVILDMERVQDVDFTAIHVLEQMGKRLAERGGRLVFSDLPERLPKGLKLARYFQQLGLIRGKERARVFPELDDALAWCEGRVLLEHKAPPHWSAPALDAAEIDFLKGMDAASLSALRPCLETRSLRKGAVIFKHGEGGGEMFLVRRGRVRIVLPVTATKGHHLATFARGDTFGELEFLDSGGRAADAFAAADTELYALARPRFDAAAAGAPGLSGELFGRLARLLALRLRQTDQELRAFREG